MTSTDTSERVDVDLTLTPMCEFAGDDGEDMHGDAEPAVARYRHICPGCGDVDSGLIGERCIAWLERQWWQQQWVITCMLCGVESQYNQLTVHRL